MISYVTSGFKNYLWAVKITQQEKEFSDDFNQSSEITWLVKANLVTRFVVL